MKRKRKSVGFVAFIVFVAMILVSGYALNAAGYDNNPFDQIAFLSGSLGSDGGGRFGHTFAPDSGNSDFALPASSDTALPALSDPSASSSTTLPGLSDTSGIDLTGLSTTASLQLPPVSDLSSSDSGALGDPGANGFGGPDRGDQNSISWSDIGDVLYNVWFICATTAVFIVVQYVFKFTLKQFKRRSPVLAAAK